MLLDEPFGGGLDPAGILARKEVLKRLAKMPEQTIIMTAPDPSLIEELADRILVLREGQVAAFDTPAGLRQPGGQRNIANESAGLGWSFDVLSPRRIEQLPIRDRLITSGLVGWFAFGVFAHIHRISLSSKEDPSDILALFPIVGCAWHCLVQVARYVWSHSSPIGLSGRLLTGRWLIPSYDVAFVPILYYVAVLTVGIFLTHSHVGWPMRHVLPALLTVYILLVNVGCPDVDTWRLTCKARLTSAYNARTKVEYDQL